MPVTVPPLGAGFRHKRTAHGTLVVPRHSKWAWTPEELPFRSAIVRDGQFVSLGFPKFFGIEEASGMADVGRLRAELAATGRLRLREKRDGVLAIRSVIDGQVIWRTRGTHDGGAHTPAISHLAPAALTDPELLPGSSILFELTVPEFRIVIDYADPTLTLLGVIDHATQRMQSPDALPLLAERIGVPVPVEEWWTGSWKALIRQISRREGTEGVVAISADGQTQLKLKTDSYCTLHQIRFVGEGKLLAELWERCRWTSIDDAQTWLARHGADMNLVPTLRPRVQRLLDTDTHAVRRVAELDTILLAAQTAHIGKPKAALAAARAHCTPEESDAMALLADGRESAAEESLRRTAVIALLDMWELEDATDGT